MSDIWICPECSGINGNHLMTCTYWTGKAIKGVLISCCLVLVFITGMIVESLL